MTKMRVSLQEFIEAVTDSALLNQMQKQAFLDRPELLPESYRQTVMTLLKEFDSTSRKRYNRVAPLLDR